jgi:ATP-binding cassette subfamily E protein 1
MKMKRIAIIDREKCLKEKCGYICQKVCPGVLMGEETVVIDKDGYPIISEILCTGCGICPKKCPANCITIINLAQEFGEIIFQYGVNMFRLYGLALADQTGVIGFIGKNGIGKSTALKILGGILIPNFGEYEKKPDLDFAIKKLNPNQANYFKKLKNNQIKISLKPQQIDKLNTVFSGSVIEFLKKINSDEQKINYIIENFKLSKILDKSISVLSGGELQKVVIAGAFLKEADLYYFDEPASYLDIYERIEIAKLIKKLGEQKSVIVIEHDLAIFDYLVDFVYIFFGQENAYGVISNKKNSRVGINQYLEGYLKEENIRFRDYEIKFQKSASEQPRSQIAFSYPSFSKTFDGFKLKAQEGNILEGEVVGIIGRNSLGKTIFVSILGGLINPDDSSNFNVSKKTISFKPQYIKIKEDMLVLDYLKQNNLDAYFFEQICSKLNINSLADKYLSQLSGGELQRVEIAKAIATKADIYILDEPSAFLDIEQRLNLSWAIQQLISNSSKACFVVDHDLVFLDAISNRIAVFEGESSVYGFANAPQNKKDGFNKFLKSVGITLRRDIDTNRPKINKPDSRLDKEQKEKDQYYYLE